VTAHVEVDVLVVGAGMAGLTAALRATELGRTVMVVEKAPLVGGSARLSGAFLWTILDRDAFGRECPRGDPALRDVIVGEYPRMVEWVRSTGVHFSELRTVTSGTGYQIDIVGYLHLAARRVEAAGGIVLLDADVDSLEFGDDGAVAGALIRDGAGTYTVRAGATILATGGFQGSSAWLHKYFGDAASTLLRRSNPHSTGDGLRLGLSAGADTTDAMDAFYGHLLASPLPELVPAGFVRFARVYSAEGVLVNVAGQRFTDEWRGDHVNCQAAVTQPQGRVALIIDEETHVGAASSPIATGMEAWDTVADAYAVGARVTSATTVAALAEGLREWGYDADRIESAVSEHREAATAAGVRTLGDGPYHAMEVRPGITFTQGGLRIDDETRVRDVSGEVIEGLYAAGADAGGVFNGGYAGGLSMSAVTGLRAAEGASRRSSVLR